MKTTLQPPKSLDEFFPWLRGESERHWGNIEIIRDGYGLQLQKGTKWLPGLTDDQIEDYEKAVGFEFPEIYKKYLQCMNGTNKETINVYGESGEPYGYGIGYYSYPRDIEDIKEKISWIIEEFKITYDDLEHRNIPHIIPIVGHRFLVADRCKTNPILSMYGNDVVPYAESLDKFLFYTIFRDFEESGQQPDIPGNLKVKFWLE